MVVEFVEQAKKPRWKISISLFTVFGGLLWMYRTIPTEIQSKIWKIASLGQGAIFLFLSCAVFIRYFSSREMTAFIPFWVATLLYGLCVYHSITLREPAWVLVALAGHTIIDFGLLLILKRPRKPFRRRPIR